MSDQPDGGDHRNQSAAERAAERNQHRRHQRRRTEAARRPDAEPAGRPRPRRVLGKRSSTPAACPAAVEVGTRHYRNRSARPTSLDRRRVPRQPDGAADHRPSLHTSTSTPRVAYGVSVRLQGLADPDPRHGPARSQLPGQPAAPLQRSDPEAQRRPARAAGQPARCGDGARRSAVHALHGTRAAAALDAVHDRLHRPRRRVPGAAAVRARAEHRTRLAESRRLHLATPSTSRATTASSTSPTLSTTLPAGLRRADPVGAAVRRTAGAGRAAAPRPARSARPRRASAPGTRTVSASPAPST